MRKIAGILFAVLALSLVVPVPVLAGSLGDDCSWEKVKWEDNPDSCFLYLNNWGKTPITAMSRLAGLRISSFGTNTATPDPGSCFGNCASCNDEAGNLGGCTDPKACKVSTECPGTECSLPPSDTGCPANATYGAAHCCCYWGISLAFANKSWGGKDLANIPRLSNNHPNHFGNSDRRSAGGGGDWGITGAPHSECAADIWALQCNMDKDSACTK